MKSAWPPLTDTCLQVCSMSRAGGRSLRMRAHLFRELHKNRNMSRPVSAGIGASTVPCFGLPEVCPGVPVVLLTERPSPVSPYTTS